MNHFGNKDIFIWSLADLLLRPFEPLVLSQIDEGEVCVMEEQLEAVR